MKTPARKRVAAATTTGSRSKLPAAAVAEIFRRFAAAEPDPKSELRYTSPFTLLVAVVLSAQATDAGVNKATPALFALADTPDRMAALGEAKVTELIRTIGLFRNKAKNVVALSRKLIADFGGKVPQTREELETLPGVGRKTANVVLNVAFGQPTMAVDTHIFRVCNRTGLAPGRDPLAVELALEKRRAGPVPAARPPLADPARALCVHGAQARLPALPDRRPLPLPRQDPVTGARLRPCLPPL